MDTLVIQGRAKLKGRISCLGSKNASLALLAASVLFDKKIILHNLPRIGDVETMIKILASLGSRYQWLEEHSLELDNSSLKPDQLDFSLVKKIRPSLVLMGPLAARFGTIKISTPGGCNIGSRPIDAHLQALRELGFSIQTEADHYVVKRGDKWPSQIVMSEFSVTGTENVILAAAGLDADLQIKIAAADHPVQELCFFLQAAGLKIAGIGSHSLIIQGGQLQGLEYTIMPDPIEAGTFLALAGATNSPLRIDNLPLDFLTIELQKFREAGVSFEIIEQRPGPGGNYQLADVQVSKSAGLKAISKLHDMPYPGFLPDLLQPFAVLLTQAQGVSLIYDWMYDGRLKYVQELTKMGADLKVLDPHRLMIAGPTPLYGKDMISYDIRAGASLVIAALIADGQSLIKEANQIDRGYEKLAERLATLGADIKRV